MPLLSPRPRLRIKLGPIIPTLLRRKRRKMTPTRPRVERFFHRFCRSLLLYLARNLCITNSPSIASTLPSSNSRNRFSASSAQASSIAFWSGLSRLESKWSARIARSSGGSDKAAVNMSSKPSNNFASRRIYCRGGTPWPPDLHRIICIEPRAATECHPYN